MVSVKSKNLPFDGNTTIDLKLVSVTAIIIDIIIIVVYFTLSYGYNSTHALIGCWAGKIFL